MQTKTIKCPQCGALLKVKILAGETVKQVNCPQCGVLMQLRFHAGGQPSANTQVPVHGSFHSPALLYKQKCYELKDGKNIIGRKATTSAASLQIETADRMMSRQHAMVEVSRTAKGTLHAVISNYQNKNATLVNGVPLQADDKIRLMNQYVVTLGETEMIYVEESQKQESK